jgi:hypothetical protein
MNTEKLARARELEIEANRLRKEAFEERPLPDKWRIGQMVRFIVDKEWAWGAGTVAQIVKTDKSDKPADKYQVFWTSTDPGKHLFWTTPNEVEFVSETPPKAAKP